MNSIAESTEHERHKNDKHAIVILNECFNI